MQFDRVCKLFCEDPATSQSDEFFGVFDIYITSMNEARTENENIRRKPSKVLNFIFTPYYISVRVDFKL